MPAFPRYLVTAARLPWCPLPARTNPQPARSPSCRRNVFHAGFLPRWGTEISGFYLFERQACIMRPLDNSSVGRCQRKKGAPRSYSTQRYGNSTLVRPMPWQAWDAWPLPVRRCSSRFSPSHSPCTVACSLLGPHCGTVDGGGSWLLHFSSPAGCRQDQRRTRPKERALAGPGRPGEPGWHLSLASQILPVPSPPRSVGCPEVPVGPSHQTASSSLLAVSFPSSSPFPSPPVSPPTT